MLSILIPIYNYNVNPLVEELHKQCIECKIDFEIICIDDASTDYKLEKNKMQFLPNCTYIELTKNIGRSSIRNLLATKSNHDWLLFLDCDTFPKSDSFIYNYYNHIKTKSKNAYFGGLLYKDVKPENDQLLRWTFGKKREAIPLHIRKKEPYKTAFTSNFIIEKCVFKTILFDEKINTYGYEDYSFINSLKENNIVITHIENPLFHLNLETSKLFLLKTKTALETLILLHKTNFKAIESTKIIKVYKILNFIKIDFIVSKLFKMLQLKLEENLTSKKPSLILFDLYKIGYFCFLNSN